MAEKIHYKFIEGKNIDLVPYNMEHLELYVKWVNDLKVRLYSRNMIPKTVEEYKKRIESSNERYPTDIGFEIFHKKDKKPIGTCGIFRINWIDRKAFVGLSIGEPDYWGQNLATEATSLIVKYAFEELNLRKLMAHINAPNIGSWRCAEKNGFIRIGILEKDTYVNGEYIDTYIYSLAREKWRETEINLQ